MIFSITLGAFGAHALSEILNEAQLKSFNTANQYLTIHGLAFLILAVFPKFVLQASRIIFTGALVFSLSIFLLVFLGHQELKFPKILGLITPIGGLMMIVGWLLLLYRIIKAQNRNN